MVSNLPEKDPFGQKNFLLENKIGLLALSIFFFGLFLLALGVGLYFFKNQKTADDIQIISASQSEALQGKEIVVHIDGAVKVPGVYKLKSDSRVNDAILAAGGLTSSANQGKINLAAKVSDGQKVHVAAVDESVSAARGQGQVAGDSTSGLIDINTASESELDKLPGVGPATAQKIIAGRPYSSKEELVSKKAVSSSVFEKIKEMISY